MTPKKPTFVVIGSAKCGTTSLAAILDRHPDCCFSRPKEVQFFQDTWISSPNPNFAKGWEWYRQAWAHYNGEAVVGEASPQYSERTRSPGTARRIYEFNPAMKIIYMVRKPLERQVSAWRMNYFNGATNGQAQYIGDKWALQGFTYWLQSQQLAGQWNEVKYDFQLEAYRDFFPEANILVSFLEDWGTDFNAEIQRIAMFVGLDPARLELGDPRGQNRADELRVEYSWARDLRHGGVAAFLRPLLPSGIKNLTRNRISSRKFQAPEPDMNPDLVAEFTAFVAEDNARLLNRYGKPAAFWNKNLKHQV